MVTGLWRGDSVLHVAERIHKLKLAHSLFISNREHGYSGSPSLLLALGISQVWVSIFLKYWKIIIQEEEISLELWNGFHKGSGQESWLITSAGPGTRLGEKVKPVRCQGFLCDSTWMLSGVAAARHQVLSSGEGFLLWSDTCFCLHS